MTPHQTFQDTCIRIGQLVMSQAETDSAGMYWHTKAGHEPDSWYVGTSIYSGTAGIALFLTELWRLTGGDEFQVAAHQALLWAENEVTNPRFPVFNLFMGSLGVVVVRLRLYEVSGDGAHLDRARETYAYWRQQVPEDSLDEADLLAGAAGIVLGLLYYYNITGSNDALARLERVLNGLLRSSRVDGEGLCWNRRFQNASALCGLAHGAAGIGLSLLEAGKHLESPACMRAAELAFRYEDQHWDDQLKNWPDLRVCWTPERVEAVKATYRQAKDAQLPQQPDTVAWCHGAPGIGLARLRALEILGGRHHLRAVVNALRRTRRRLRIPLSQSGLGLCHGQCGRAALFLEAYRCLDRAELLEEATEYCERVVAHVGRTLNRTTDHSDEAVDVGLFLGLAGTGYLLLQVLDEQTMPILALRPPVRESRASVREGKTHPVVVEHPYLSACRTSLPCTFRAADRTQKRRFSDFFETVQTDAASLQGVLSLFAKDMLESEEAGGMNCISDAYAVDSQLLALDASRTSDTHTFASLTTAMEDAKEELQRGISRTRRVRWSDQISVLRTKWPWEAILQGDWPACSSLSPDGYGMLVFRTPAGPRLQRLSEIEDQVLKRSREVPTIQELTAAVVGLEPPDGRAVKDTDFQEAFVYLLRSGILILDDE